MTTSPSLFAASMVAAHCFFQSWACRSQGASTSRNAVSLNTNGIALRAFSMLCPLSFVRHRLAAIAEAYSAGASPESSTLGSMGLQLLGAERSSAHDLVDLPLVEIEGAKSGRCVRIAAGDLLGFGF